ncbi:hypothetical protein [Pectobacterium aroidearum]|uniref:hypothetical protein n=1 Tax=Pectobacterium aroidearum TaxID=1201031 RepID=UPI003306E9CA
MLKRENMMFLNKNKPIFFKSLSMLLAHVYFLSNQSDNFPSPMKVETAMIKWTVFSLQGAYPTNRI